MIKEKLSKAWQWIKAKAKQIAIALGIIGIATAAIITPITPEEIVWKGFTDNLIAIEYQHEGKSIDELKNLKGIWKPTEKAFEKIYQYAYGNDPVPWQKLDGTEMSPLITLPDGTKERTNLVPHWEQEFNNAKERGEIIEKDIIKGLRNGVRKNEVNADIYSIEIISQNKFDWRSIFADLIQKVFAGVEFEDHFGVAVSSVLKDHTPDTTGTGWTDLRNTGACDLWIANITGPPTDPLDAATSINFGGCAPSEEGDIVEADDVLSDDDYTVEVTQINGDTSDDKNVLVCRATDSTHFYVGYWNESDSDLYEFNGTCGNNVDGAAVADGSTVTLSCVGTDILLKDDGATIVTLSDATQTTGKAGVGMGNMGCDANDDVSTQRLDDFVVTVSGAPPAARRIIITE